MLSVDVVIAIRPDRQTKSCHIIVELSDIIKCICFGTLCLQTYVIG